jgi:NAD(P)H-hydrate epimerase
VITGLRAQGVEPFEAAICGAWIHAQSGLFAAQLLGTNSSVIAGDLIEAIPEILHSIDR